MKSLKMLGFAGSLVAAALVGGTLISIASAAPSTSAISGAAPANDSGDGAAYCATWKTTFADELDVSVGELIPAAKAAAVAVVDAAVENGDLTADKATEIKARINAADGTGCGLLGGFVHRFGAHHPLMGGRHDLIDAAATAIGITPQELISALREGDSLKQIAADNKVSYDTVSAAVLAAAKADLDALVADGKLTQARADEMLSRLTDALKTGHFPRLGGFGPRHMG